MMSRLGTRPAQGRKGGNPSMGRGTVVRLDRSKGYGFVLDSSGEQRFFHRSAVLDDKFDSLQEQQSVEFEPYSDERGARAQKVRPAGTAVRPESMSPSRPSPRAPKAAAPVWKSDLSPFRNGSGSSANRKRPKI
jgi:CspA family cold shock protein